MSIPNLNLARRPFLNSRPVVRLTVALWVLGTLLLAINGVRYWRYATGSEDRAADLAALEARVVEYEQRLAELRADVGAYDVEGQNEQVTFLNQKIAERTFGWSELFDRLEEVLPDDVRLTSLSPSRAGEKSRRRRAERESEGMVKLSLRGVAKTFEAELDLVDRLFAHPSFERPRLSRDQSNKLNQTEFDITVYYRPGELVVEEATLADAAEPAATTDSGAGEPAAEPGRGRTRTPASLPARSAAAGRPERSIQPPTVVRSAPPVTVGSEREDLRAELDDQDADPDETSSVRAGDEQQQRERRAGRSASSRPQSDRTPSTTGRRAAPRPTTGAAGFAVPSRDGGSAAGGAGSGGAGRTPARTPGFLPRQPSASSALEPR